MMGFFLALLYFRIISVLVALSWSCIPGFCLLPWLLSGL